VQPNADQLLFAHVVDRPDEEVDLAVAALMVAELEYTNLDVAHYVEAIESLAEGIRSRLPSEASVKERVRRVSRTLFEDQGYRGNAEDYYDPRNSFLNQVLERKTGIPISLAVLWMEIARRVGLVVGGLNFPGHFLVRVEVDDGFVIVDPFHGGLTVTIDELNARLRAVLGPDAQLAAEHLVPADKRAIVSRMLGNLSAIYRRDNDVSRAIAVLERQLVLQPKNLRLQTELAELRRRVGVDS
jgi:regulator of sirC expression with transglutaminase-like and TPR domain